MQPFLRKGAFLTEVTIPAQCQVRSKTESPCPHLAVVEIRGVAFCGACAREQEAYFAMGELVAQQERQGLRSKALAEALKRMRRERGWYRRHRRRDASRALGRTRARASRA